jgi:hypothetical protein
LGFKSLSEYFLSELTKEMIRQAIGTSKEKNFKPRGCGMYIVWKNQPRLTEEEL